jgi:hypothetical protein
VSPSGRAALLEQALGVRGVADVLADIPGASVMRDALFLRNTATRSSSARTMTYCETSLHGTEYRLRSKGTRHILLTPVPSTSSVLKGVSGRV